MNRGRTGQPVEILLVEHDAGDIQLVVDALSTSQVRNNVHVAEDGLKAMAVLRRGAQSGDAVRPDLILLDLNVPRKDGREVLAKIKGDQVLKSIPVIVLARSDAVNGAVECYQLQANCVIRKPVDINARMTMVRSIDHFWLTVATLPGSVSSR